MDTLPMQSSPERSSPDERGFALLLVLLVMFVTGALLLAATVVGTNQLLISRYHERASVLDDVADGGLERARASLNADDELYPDSSYVALEASAPVDDGAGGTLPGIERSVYAGPTGITSGQFGVYGTILSVARDQGGAVAVRRLQVQQESFAKFAYFTNTEPSNISFGGGDQIFGPVHTNDELKIYSSGATFHSDVTTARDVQGEQYGTFKNGYEEYATAIPMPETADLLKLQTQAIAGGTSYSADEPWGSGNATLRIEFVARDMNTDGDNTDENEGFIRVYRSDDTEWLVAERPASSSPSLRDSRNCGHFHADGTFIAAVDHPTSGPDNWMASLVSSSRRCYLGGADSLFNEFVPDDGTGEWLAWPGTVDPLLTGEPDGAYLHPINRPMNPSFKGVIFVEGDVVVSGELRGRVTVAATGEIVIGDDLVYATDPGLGTCSDLLGLFSGSDVVVADNTLNAPSDPDGGPGNNYFTYDDTKDEFIHGVILALDNFTVENFAGGATRDERCEGALWGRGCLYLTGGIIQETRGAVGTIGWVGGTGYVKRYSYDACAAEVPPPYFPTTGHFSRGQYYPVDPVGFDVGEFFSEFQAN